ncbi:hypothetical protein FSPOR_6707 [Fusarium sporotrichioides]|uniref:BTB domain-containing protein n=1 Tax=Fusarium sporotrichioides TaxID=5514 RepID=A0A395S2Q2_FUSSP|nr:hypothetical protein FSPOR_6707 [Fusarium sporotrichioides]
MWSVTHEVDPDGDVIVILKKPNTANVIPEISLRNETKLGIEDDATFRPDNANVKIPTMDSGLPNNAALGNIYFLDQYQVSLTFDLHIAQENDEVRFLVSSRHLTTASATFKTTLSPPWTQSKAASSKGSSPSNSSSEETDSSAEEWHAYALLTVFNIIHGKGSRVPRKVSLEFFAHVALIADFYDCTDNLSTTAELWYELNYKRPGKYGKEVIMWLFIAWVFSWPNTFAEMARLTVRAGEGRGRVETHDLAIAQILDDLDVKRKHAINQLTEELRILDGNLRHAKIGCNNTCRSVMLGSLVIEKLNNRDLVTSWGHLGCHGVSLSRVIVAINDFAPTEWREASNRVHPCNATKLMQPTIDEVENTLKRLRITEFKHLIFTLSTFGILASAITDINFIMKVIQHDIDPGGDLLIVLKSPNSLILTPHLPKEDDVCQPLPFSSLSIFGDDFGSKDVEVEFRVSSYHMIQSSTYFEKMLKGPWKETHADNRDIESRFRALSCEETAEDIATTPIHLRRVSATGWNANALATVLNIIHGNTSGKHVPRDVNYVFLAQVAVIVDYYQCEGCVLVATGLWRGTVDFPELVHSNIMKLYISWAFSWDKRFSHAAWHSSADSLGLTLFEINDLPVAELLDILEQRRRDGIEKILAGFDDAAEMSLDNCSYMCSAAMLAIIIHHRTTNQPFRGISIREMSNHVRNPTADDDEHISIKMVSITYEIDPRGDIELVLNKPNNQKIIPVLRFTKDVRDLDDEKFDNPPCLGRYSVFKELCSPDETNASPVDSEVRLRVSSRHLILASRTFRAMLEGPWSEATSSCQSVRQINATDWDAMAFAVVLDIIHGRPRGIPEKMNIGLLARIATVVDYYECHDAMHACLKNWLSENPELSDPMLNLCKTSLLCLYVAWVFSEKSTISNMTYLALSHGEGLAQIDTFDLPLGVMLDTIDDKRQSLISKSLQLFDDLRKDLLDEKGCPQRDELECTALTLGVLMRAQYQLFSPERPLERPYNGYSITNVLLMESIRYDIDPGGDAEIVLKGFINAQGIIPSIDWDTAEHCDPKLDDEKDGIFDNPILDGRYAVFNIPDETETETEIEVRMRVSSRHLILASRTFRAMLEGPWSENLSRASQAQSSPVEIMASKCDAAALAIVLDAIHGRYQDIPRDVNVGLLTRIATIIDYYECHECLQLISREWVVHLWRYKKPNILCEGSLLWLYFAWVLSDHHVLSSISKILLREGIGLSYIHLQDLPLSPILEKIDAKRQELINRLITGLDNLHYELLKETTDTLTGSHWSTAMLGNLIRKQYQLEILYSNPDAPYSGHSVSSIVTKIFDPPTLKSKFQNLLDEIDREIWFFECEGQHRAYKGG